MNTNLELLSLVPDRNGETGAECEIILPDYCPNILRILQASATPTLTSAVRTGDRLTVEGSVEYHILYLPEDGSGLKTVSQQAPFACSLDLGCDDNADFSVSITPRNCVARALNPQKIFARCTVQINVKINQNKPLPQPGISDDCETRICRRNAAKLICSAQKPLRISDEFEMDSGKVATMILQNKITFRETEQKPLTDKLIVKADMIFDILCAADDNSLFTVRKVFPISQILDFPGIVPNAVCRTNFETVSANIIAKEESSDGSQSMTYDIEINVSGWAYEEIVAGWTEDAYSIKKITECVKEPITTERFLRIEESGSVRETMEIGTCSNILWVDVLPELRGLFYRSDGGKIVCEGVWGCRILMTDPDGTPCSAVREIPFTLEIPADGCTSATRNDTTLILTDLTWSLTDASHIEIRGTYRWNGLIFTRETSEIVTAVHEKANRPRASESVILYYGMKGESAWKIAKDHACPYSEFIRTNKLENDILDEQKMLMIVCC